MLTKMPIKLWKSAPTQYLEMVLLVILGISPKQWMFLMVLVSRQWLKVLRVILN